MPLAAILLGSLAALHGAEPSTAEEWWRLGIQSYEREDWSRAARAFARSADLNPRVGNTFVMLGLCEYRLGRYPAALTSIRKGKSLGYGSDRQLRQVVTFHEGMLLLHTGDFDGAQRTLGTLSRDGVESAELIAGLGWAVLAIKPGTASDLVRQAGWAEHLAAQDKFGPAEREYHILVRQFPRERNVQYALGRFLLLMNKDREAISAFERELDNTPGHLLARLAIAEVALKIDAPEGLKYAEEAVKLNPAVPLGRYLLGMQLLNAGETSRAIRELEFACKAEPNDARVYWALSRAYTMANREQDAARAAEIFTKLKEAETKRP